MACIIFEGGKTVSGYGCVRVKNVTKRVHRLVWEQCRGKIPTGLNVLHKCDNRPCYNLKHLFLGTQKDNMTDMKLKGRHYTPFKTKEYCLRGHKRTIENTVHRACRECMRTYSRRKRK